MPDGDPHGCYCGIDRSAAGVLHRLHDDVLMDAEAARRDRGVKGNCRDGRIDVAGLELIAHGGERRLYELYFVALHPFAFQQVYQCVGDDSGERRNRDRLAPELTGEFSTEGSLVSHTAFSRSADCRCKPATIFKIEVLLRSDGALESAHSSRCRTDPWQVSAMNSGRSLPSVSSTSRPLRAHIPLTIATCAGSVLPAGKRATRMRVVPGSDSCAV